MACAALLGLGGHLRASQPLCCPFFAQGLVASGGEGLPGAVSKPLWCRACCCTEIVTPNVSVEMKAEALLRGASIKS